MKNGVEITKDISYILQCIDKARFMASSLSNIVSNLSEGIDEVNMDTMINNVKSAEFPKGIPTVSLIIQTSHKI